MLLMMMRILPCTFILQTPFRRWDADEDKDMREVLDYALASDPHPRDFVVKRAFFSCVVDKLRSHAEWARKRTRISLERSLLRTLVDSGRIKGKYTKDAHTRKVSGRVYNVFLGIRMSTTPPTHRSPRTDDDDDAPRGPKKPRGHRQSNDDRNSRLATSIASYIGLSEYQAEKKRENSRKRSKAYRERRRIAKNI
jgi:hypothetical protein